MAASAMSSIAFDFYAKYLEFDWFHSVKQSGFSFMVLFPVDFHVALYSSHSSMLVVSDELSNPMKQGDFVAKICGVLVNRLWALVHSGSIRAFPPSHPGSVIVGEQRQCLARFAEDIQQLLSSPSDAYGGPDLFSLQLLLEKLTFFLNGVARAYSAW